MPIINVQTTPLTKEQKSEMIRRMTQVTSEVTGASEEVHIVLIDELPYDAVGMGTKSVADLREKR